MRAILSEIARDPRNRAAQVSAIRALRELDRGGEVSDGSFADLDDELGRRRIRRKAG